MKLKYVLMGFVLFLSVNCSSENEEDLAPDPEDKCEDNSATLSGAISTILGTNCAVSGCHVSGTGRVDFTIKQNIIQNANQIRTFTQNGTMPPAGAGSLTTQQKDDIYCWVKNGAQDN